MPSGIHRSSYSSARPGTPNVANDPLGLAPGATVTVYHTGFITLASIFTDQPLTNPLANPFVTDVNGFYSYFTDAAFGDVDEQISGLGIASPYTLPMVLNLDPRVGGTAGDVVTLTEALQTEAVARFAADLLIEQAGFVIPLGGSLTNGQQDVARLNVLDSQFVTIPPLPPGYTGTVFVTLRTDSAGTSVTAYLRDLTSAADVGNSAAVTSTTNATSSFAVPLVAGHQYVLQILNSNAISFTYALGYLAVAHP